MRYGSLVIADTAMLRSCKRKAPVSLHECNNHLLELQYDTRMRCHAFNFYVKDDGRAAHNLARAFFVAAGGH